MFALVSSKEGSREFFDLTGPFKARSEAHPDGWGVGWYHDGAPVVAKAPKRADQDKLFTETIKKVRSTAIVAHIRKASAGPPAMENTHPFVHERWMFAHNGTFCTKPALRDKLPEERAAQLEGSTDSEELFHWVLHNIAQRKDAVMGIAAAMEWVRKNLGPGATALNFFLTNGRHFYAYRYAYCKPDHYTLMYVQRPATLAHTNTSVVLATDRLSGEGWKTLENGSLLELALLDGGKLTTTIHDDI